MKFEPDYNPELFSPKPFLEPSSLKLGRGKLVTWTVLHTPPEGFEPPLTLGYVQLADGAVILAHGEMEKNPALDSKVSVDVAGEHFVFKPYDPTKRIWEQIDGVRKTVIGWWDAVEGAATQAARDRKAAKLKEARRKKREQSKTVQNGD